MDKAGRDKEEIDFIKTPERWPVWPILPVKVLGGDGIGIMLANEPTVTVYKINMLNLKQGLIRPQLEDVEAETFESIEALVAAGWVVD